MNDTTWNMMSIFAACNIILDALLTDFALEAGKFYELNPFTNSFGVFMHAGLLLLMIYLACKARKEWQKTEIPLTIFMMYICVLWFINNIVSVVILCST